MWGNDEPSTTSVRIGYVHSPFVAFLTAIRSGASTTFTLLTSDTGLFSHYQEGPRSVAERPLQHVAMRVSAEHLDPSKHQPPPPVAVVVLLLLLLLVLVLHCAGCEWTQLGGYGSMPDRSPIRVKRFGSSAFLREGHSADWSESHLGQPILGNECTHTHTRIHTHTPVQRSVWHSSCSFAAKPSTEAVQRTFPPLRVRVCVRSCRRSSDCRCSTRLKQ